MLQGKNLENRHYNQKVAAFNLGASEAVKVKYKTKRYNYCHFLLIIKRKQQNTFLQFYPISIIKLKLWIKYEVWKLHIH